MTKPRGFIDGDNDTGVNTVEDLFDPLPDNGPPFEEEDYQYDSGDYKPTSGYLNNADLIDLEETEI